MKPEPNDSVYSIVVDDDIMNCRVLSEMLAPIPEIIVKSYFSDPREALKYLQDESIDLIFIDIIMPEMSGFEFVDRLQSLPITPKIIFVSAYREKSIEAIKKSAFDFILKPVNHDELQLSITRYLKFRQQIEANEKIETHRKLNNSSNKIKFKGKGGIYLIDPDKIVYIESEGNYSWVHLLGNRTEMVTLQIGKIFEMIEDFDFFRISRQNIINLKYLYKVDKKKACCYLKIDPKIIEFDMVKSKVTELIQIV